MKKFIIACLLCVCAGCGSTPTGPCSVVEIVRPDMVGVAYAFGEVAAGSVDVYSVGMNWRIPQASECR